MASVASIGQEFNCDTSDQGGHISCCQHGTKSQLEARHLPQRGHISGVEVCFCFPPFERCFISYVPAPKVRRYVRQEQIDRLTGEYAELLLNSLAVRLHPDDWKEELVRNRLLRNTAVRAADKHERGVYERIKTEEEYLREMGEKKARDDLIDIFWWSLIPGSDDKGSLRSSSDKSDVRCFEPRLSTDETFPENGDAQEVEQDASTDTPKSGEFENPPFKTTLIIKKRSSMDPAIAKKSHTGTAFHGAECEQMKSINITTPGSEAHHTEALNKYRTTEISNKNKRQRVSALVKESLDIFYAIKETDREIYNAIVERATQKVLAANLRSKDSGFVVRQRKKIVSLVCSYVAYYDEVSKKQKRKRDSTHECDSL